MALLCAHPGMAGEWTIVPRLNVEETYTDNTAQAAPGQERHEFITSIEPGIAVRGTGRRLQVNFEYNLEGLRYARNRAADVINHQMQAGADAELYEQVLFIEARASRSQQSSNTLVSNASDNLTVGNATNKTDTTTFSVAPIVRHHFGTYADYELRYDINSVTNESNGRKSRTGGTVSSATLRGGEEFARIPWTLRYTSRTSELAGGGENTFRKAEAEVRYRFNRKYGVVVRFGKERNEFASSQPSQDGNFWSVGGTWTPSERTSFEAGLDKRFFDQSYYFRLSHRSRRLLWKASYSQDITTSRQQQLDRQLVALVDEFGDPVFDPVTGTQIEIPQDSLVINDEVISSRDLDASLTYTGRRTRATLSLNDSERTGQQTSNESRVTSLRLNVSRELSRHDRLNVGASVQVSETGGGVRSDQLMRGNVSYSRQFGTNLRGTVGLSRVEQTSDGGGGEYTENRLTVGLFATF